MKKKLHIFALLLACVLTVSVMTACGSGSTPSTAAATAKEDETTTATDNFDGLDGEVTPETWEIWDTMAVEKDASGYDFTGAADDADFVPTIEAYLLPDQSTVKGNIFVLSGGADTQRNDSGEGIPCCTWLNSIGYNAYLVEYRVAPYLSVDATLDLQRAIRYVKYHAEEKGIGNIEQTGMIGFSAGAMHCYAEAIMMCGTITPDSIYTDYTCDDIDAENADVKVCMCIYAAGSPHNTAGESIDISAPIMLLDAGDPNYPAQLPSFFFAGASGHYASQFCVEAYQTMTALVPECELHIYGGITGPFAMGYDYAGSDQMIDQIEAFLDVQFGYRNRTNG